MSIEFPTHVYKSPGAYPTRGGKSYSVKTAHDDVDVEDAKAAGWHLTLADALSPPAAPPKTEYPIPSRKDLEEKAVTLGIKFDGRTSDAKLAKLIEAEAE